MSEYRHGWWHSADGLRLHYREYPGSGEANRPVVLCLPGLTRNARDFAELAERISAPAASGDVAPGDASPGDVAPGGGGWRVICAEMRGRGMSDYAADAATYTPLHYVGDVVALLDQAGISRAVIIGTSLGGVMAMVLGMLCPQRLAGAVINDIGPVIEAEGLAKIASYVGVDPRFADWAAAAEALHGRFADIFPHWAPADWLAMARRVMVEADGAIRFDYDPRIAEPFAAAATESAPAPDLWPGLEGLGTAGPLLVVRGGLSDILSVETLAEMARRVPGLESLTLPDIGHAPTLDEPEAAAAIARLLDRVR